VHDWTRSRIAAAAAGNGNVIFAPKRFFIFYLCVSSELKGERNKNTPDTRVNRNFDGGPTQSNNKI
jgi:hypothetical protein